MCSVRVLLLWVSVARKNHTTCAGVASFPFSIPQLFLHGLLKARNEATLSVILCVQICEVLNIWPISKTTCITFDAYDVIWRTVQVENGDFLPM